METVNCELCGSADKEVMQDAPVQRYGHAARFQVVRCRQCELVYITPRPDKAEIGDYYPPAYQADMRRILQEAMANPITRKGLEMVRRRRTISNTSAGASRGKLLEIGAASGVYLLGQRELGWEVEGIEIDPESAEYARREHGLNVHAGDAEEILATLPADSFGAVAMWHVLEHLHHPHRILHEVYRVLKPGGYLMLEVPNFSSPLASLFGRYWFPLEIPRHLYHFTPHTLRVLLEGVGLTAVQLKGVPSAEVISWSWRALRAKQIGELESDPLNLNPLAMALLFPVSWSMAQFNRSDHMAARAVKPQNGVKSQNGGEK